MKEKYYRFTSFVFMGIVLIILGILLFLGKNVTYHYLVNVLTFVLWVNFFKVLFKFFSRKLSKKEENHIFLSCFFHLFICVLFVIFENFSLGIIPFLFAVYLILIGIAQIVMCFLEILDKDYVHFGHILIAMFCFLVSIPIFVSPVSNLNTFLMCFSLYCILLGISMVWDAIVGFLSVHTKNRLKRKIRITLPKIIEAIIPYSIMSEINRNLALEKKQEYSFEKKYDVVDMDILIHASNRGVNKMGHIDLCFDGMIYSFGNYDEGSRTFCNSIGRGILFKTSSKEDYINFCIDNSKKTVFDFGIILNERQKNAIKIRIQEIMDGSALWDYKSDKEFQKSSDSYAYRVYKKTRASFYYFRNGKYHTYFVLGTNCCSFVDDIVGKSGMDIVSINGIITPGTYYDYLNRELRLKKSNVVSKEIYNQFRRAGENKK